MDSRESAGLAILRLVGALVACSFTCSAQAGEIALLLTCERSVFEVGERVLVAPSVKNGTDREIVIWRSTFVLNHRLSVVDEQGAEPELTAFGKRISQLSELDRMERRKNYPVRIGPGQIDRGETPVDVTQFYWLPPGRYRISVSYSDFQDEDVVGVLRSNVIEIQVVPKGGEPGATDNPGHAHLNLRSLLISARSQPGV